MRVVDLADEFGITISETLALCKRFDIPAPYGSSLITSAGAGLLRGLARGEISPESVDGETLAEARGPDYKPASAAHDDVEHPDTSPAVESESAAVGDAAEDDYDYGDPDDYDSYGVAGLDDLLTTPSDGLVDKAPVREANKGASQSIDTSAEVNESAETSRTPEDSSLSAARAAYIARAPERRESPRRSRDRNNDGEKKAYDPSNMRAEYDDIDKYVPKWLKFVALGALGVFGFLAYQLFFNGAPETVENGPQQTPIYVAGDCFNADIALWIDTMAVTGCAGEHDGEIFDSFTIVGELGVAYPELSAMTSQARQACRSTFSQYTGQSSVVSDYRIGVSLPTSIEWARGDRIAYCSTISLDGTKLEGSTAKS